MYGFLARSSLASLPHFHGEREIFSGGLASRRTHVFTVILGVDVVGMVLLPILALLWGEALPSWKDALWGASAGLVGTLGLTSFYRALAVGRMGINAPITAVLAASLPVIYSAFTLGLPRPLQLAGFALALLSVALVSRPERLAGRPTGLGLALLAGLGFGGFFILIGQVSARAIFWPLVYARIVSLLFMLVFVRVRGEPMLPKKQGFPLILLAGALDVAGNVFFILAAHAGRLDVATILSSLYPAMTVLLAALILHERVSRLQAAGIVLALGAILLISA